MSKLPLILLAVLVAVAGQAAWAGSTIYGMSGLIETPDDSITQSTSLALTGKAVTKLGNSDVNVLGYGGAIGLGAVAKAEGSGGGIDTDTSGSKPVGVLNVKMKLADESLQGPSITVGVVDSAKRLRGVSSAADSASGFIVFSKNVSSVAEGLSRKVVKPLRGSVGIGTGIYQGGFAGLDWSISRKTEIVAEYLSKGLRQDRTISAGIRLSPAKGLSLEVGAIGLEDYYGGINFSLSTY